MNFLQAMIVPTMVSMGMGSLLVAQNLSLVEVGYAAPAAGTEGAPAPGGEPPAGPKAKAGGAKAKGAATPGGGPGTGAGGINSPEFGGQGPGGTVIRAVTETELAIKAVEEAGREDPFMSLVPPDPNTIVPPIVFQSPVPPGPNVPQIPVETPKPLPSVAPPPPPVVAPPRPVAVRSVKPIKLEDLPFAGDKPPTVAEPQWLVRGIMSTGYERVALLEGKDENIHARVGDLLNDGSKIEAISNRGVTFVRSGRRFVKLIGGIL